MSGADVRLAGTGTRPGRLSWSGAAAVAAALAAEPAERRRRWVVAAGAALATGLLLAVVTVVQAPAGAADVSAFVAEPGLRVGVVATVLVAMLPLLGVTAQALRVGTAARRRRTEALAVHGATGADRRRIHVVGVLRPALLGGAAGLPALGLLRVLLGVLPPPAWRVVPEPSLATVLPVWPLAAALVAGVLVLLVLRPAGPAPRDRRSRGVVVEAVALALVASWFAVPLLALEYSSVGGVALLGTPVVLAAVVLGLGRPCVLLAAALLDRVPTVHARLAAHRLRADPRTPGRPAGAVLGAAVTAGVVVAALVDHLRAGRLSTPGERQAPDLGLQGITLLLVVAAIAAALALVSLALGTVEALLDTRRQVAALVALGGSRRTLSRVLTTQLAAVTGVAGVAGVVAGCAATAVWATEDGGGTMLAALPLAAVVAPLAWAAAALVVLLLRPAVRAAASPANLRAA